MAKLCELARETLDMFRPPRDMTVSEWADANRVLTKESSSEAGRWRTSRAPYQRRIMDAFTEPGVWQIVVMAGSQVGKTEIELNMMGRAIDLDPGPILFVNPSVDFAEDFSKRRVATMIRACPALRAKVYEAKSRDAGNTITMKTFPGGSVAFTGANSPTELAGRPIRYLFMDEIDRFPASAGAEGDPTALAERRTETFRLNRKIVKTSTPTIKGVSKIERAYRLGTQEEWHTQCPACGEFSYITFDDIRFEKEEYRDENGERQYKTYNPRWKCPKCGGETGETDTKRRPAKWVPRNPKAAEEGILSFRLNAFMSPFSDWRDICREFLYAKDDQELLKTFHNTVLGETWEMSGRNEQPETLFRRRERYKAEVPDGALVLTMGIDTQDNRLEYEVVGWDREEQSWGIERGIIPHRPDSPAAWREVDALLTRDFTTESGMEMRIGATFVDSGGHHTDTVYRECGRRNLAGRKIWAIKGEAGEGREYVRVMKKSAGEEKSVKFIIAVDSGKEAILSATAVEEPGPRYAHFPDDPSRGYDEEYFRGLCSEKLVIRRRGGKSVMAWEQIHERNEPLDMRNYARAAYTFFHWPFDRIERMLKGVEEEPRPITRAEAARRGGKRRLSEGVKV